MSLLAFRDAVVNGIKAALPDVKSIEPHGGRFDEKELRTFGAAAPAVRVALLELTGVEGLQGATAMKIRCAAFVATRSTPALPRDKAALAIVTTLAATIPDNDWGLNNTQNPQAVRAANLYSGGVDSAGIALWAVTWDQQINLVETDPATLDVFQTFRTEYDIGQTPDTEKPADEITLEQ